mmetsp:Transcript_49598/g.56894  ORF Transcript_49598/g.56894 Transcript_49598/m.56894 type:complete len:203 (-) Transcript_49598:394-1002(-)
MIHYESNHENSSENFSEEEKMIQEMSQTYYLLKQMNRYTELSSLEREYRDVKDDISKIYLVGRSKVETLDEDIIKELYTKYCDIMGRIKQEYLKRVEMEENTAHESLKVLINIINDPKMTKELGKPKAHLALVINNFIRKYESTRDFGCFKRVMLRLGEKSDENIAVLYESFDSCDSDQTELVNDMSKKQQIDDFSDCLHDE